MKNGDNQQDQSQSIRRRLEQRQQELRQQLAAEDEADAAENKKSQEDSIERLYSQLPHCQIQQQLEKQVEQLHNKIIAKKRQDKDDESDDMDRAIDALIADPCEPTVTTMSQALDSCNQQKLLAKLNLIQTKRAMETEAYEKTKSEIAELTAKIEEMNKWAKEWKQTITEAERAYYTLMLKKIREIKFTNYLFRSRGSADRFEDPTAKGLSKKQLDDKVTMIALTKRIREFEKELLLRARKDFDNTFPPKLSAGPNVLQGNQEGGGRKIDAPAP